MPLIKPSTGSGGGIDTSDATAMPYHILKNKTAYARGVKITGNKSDINIASIEILKDGNSIGVWIPNGGDTTNKTYGFVVFQSGSYWYAICMDDGESYLIGTNVETSGTSYKTADSSYYHFDYNVPEINVLCSRGYYVGV